MTSRSFRNYTAEKRIGAGGMSEVLLGRHKTLGSRWAIKVLYPGLAKDQSFIDRFEREARLASTLQHNNLVQVIDFGSEEDDYFIVMQYVDGPDLDEICRRLRSSGKKPGALPVEIVLLTLEEIAHGLRAAHALNLVHRDIKPSNILISKQGDVKIADFGLARDFRQGAHDITLPGTVLGTPSYMSPEQAAGFTDLDSRSDVFSLGVVVYQLLTGDKPFRGETPTEVQQAIINEPAPSLTLENCPRVYPELRNLVEKMLQKDRDKRLQDMDEVLRGISESIHALRDGADLAIRRREHLARFAADPVGYSEELHHRSITAHLNLGFHFKSMGLEKLEDALQEFRLVLSLDPENTPAAEAILELKREVDASGIKPPRDLERAVTSASRVTLLIPADGVGAGVRTDEKPDRPNPFRFGIPAAALVVVALVLVLWKPWEEVSEPPDQTPQLPPRQTASVEMSSAPPGASVHYRQGGDGQFEQTEYLTDCTIADLPAEPTEFLFVKDGFLPDTLFLDLQPSGQHCIFVRLAAIPGKLVLSASPAGAQPEITLTHQESGEVTFRGNLPAASLEMDPGDYGVEARLSGYEMLSRDITVGSGEKVYVELALTRVQMQSRLQPDLAPPPQAAGYVCVESESEVVLEIDGKQAWRGLGRSICKVNSGVAHEIVLRDPAKFAARTWDALAVAPGDTAVISQRELSYGLFRLTANGPVDLEIDGQRLYDEQRRHELPVGAGVHSLRVGAPSGLAVSSAVVMEPEDADDDVLIWLDASTYQITVGSGGTVWINLRLVRSDEPESRPIRR